MAARPGVVRGEGCRRRPGPVLHLRRSGRCGAPHPPGAGRQASGRSETARPRAARQGRRAVTTAAQDIAATDAYQRSAEATVVEVRPEGVVLDRTVFYA